MTNSEGLPKDTAGKLAYLTTAARHGETLRSLLVLGKPVDAACGYVAANPDLVGEFAGTSYLIRYGELVHWEARIDPEGIVLGHGSGGLEPLMAALGIDFSGRPYVAGNG